MIHDRRTVMNDDLKLPAVQLGGVLDRLREWRDAQRAAEAAVAHAKKLETEFRDAMEATGKQVGLVGTTVLITRKPSSKFRSVAFTNDRPDLAEHFTRDVVRPELDVAALAQAHPDVHAQYLTPVFQVKWKNIDAVLAEAGR